MLEKTRQNIGKFGALWCGVMHDSPMWPIHGEYECRICGRRYQLQWAGDRPLPISAKLTAAEPVRIRRGGVLSFRSASLLLIITLVLLLALPVRAAGEPVMSSTEGPAMAFARYIVGLEHERPWR